MSRAKSKIRGAGLVEVMAAIAILGIVVTALGSCLVMGYRLNGYSERLMQARLAVSSAVETLMASGIEMDKVDAESESYELSLDGVTVTVSPESESGEPESAYTVTVTSSDMESVTVTTCIRASAGRTVPDEGTTGGGS